ncbi:MAG TPA: alpha/beta fold hydrolase [Labilithrix sp.]|nr:alpha/beta fold hydrolase [Labilithrix sp.]
MPLADMPPFLGNEPLTEAGNLRASLTAQVTETIATLREVVLMPLDVAPIVPRKLDHQDDVVVLIHGFFASAGVWRPMKGTLVEKTGAKVASFTHLPGVGVDRIARSLAKIVERIPKDCRVHLVGHSLGGVVARWYVQEHGGHERVTQTISLGSPFGGTSRAHAFPFLVGRDLARSSELLARLRARAHEHDVPHTSLVATVDAIVAPVESSVFPRGDVIVLPRCGHNTLLFHPESIARVVDRVAASRRVHARARTAASI